MAKQTLLSEKKSTVGSPYCYYSLDVTPSNRTTNSVKLKFDIKSHLANKDSWLGQGSSMGLTLYISADNFNTSAELKKTNVTWSGTSVKEKSIEITVSNLNPTQTKLKNVKVRVLRSNNSTSTDSNNSCYLKWTDVADISIDAGHTPPDGVTFAISEQNQQLVNAEIGNDLFVEYLSQKQFNISANVYESATINEYQIINSNTAYISSSNPFSINCALIKLLKSEDNKIPIKAKVIDNLNTSGESITNFYKYVPYIPISLVETNTIVRRNGQKSGRAKLNILGSFYSSNIGHICQGNLYGETEDTEFLNNKNYYMYDVGEYILLEKDVDYHVGDYIEEYFTTVYEKDSEVYKPTIKYKFWEYGTTEPGTYSNTIPSSNITISSNSFSVSNYEIGSTNTSASNYFDPDKSYRVKIYVSDSFNSYESSEKAIPRGEYIWGEYKDRVDFKKITCNETISAKGDIMVGGYKIGNSSYHYMSTQATITGDLDWHTAEEITLDLPKGTYMFLWSAKVMPVNAGNTDAVDVGLGYGGYSPTAPDIVSTPVHDTYGGYVKGINHLYTKSSDGNLTLTLKVRANQNVKYLNGAITVIRIGN